MGNNRIRESHDVIGSGHVIIGGTVSLGSKFMEQVFVFPEKSVEVKVNVIIPPVVEPFGMF